MNVNTRRTISKEKQEAIKRYLASNTSTHTLAPSTPKLELDANFSRILQKKREEQLEASKQRLFDSTTMSNRTESLFDYTNTSIKKVVGKEAPSPAAARKDHPVELDNSMIFGKVVNKSWNDLSGGEDSFLVLERQCRMDDKKERLLNANDTMLFDVEPPSELWNQTVNQSLTIDTLNRSQDDDDDDEEEEEETIEISPVKYVGLTRPSTIIEETSSQMESSSKNSSSSSTTATKSSLYATASLINESSLATVKESSTKSCSTSLNRSQTAKSEPSLSSSTSSFSLSTSNSSKVSPLSAQQQNPNITSKTDRQRRGTFAFKRANYTFFPNENLDPINESECLIDDDDVSKGGSVRVQHVETPKNLRSKTPIKAAEIRKNDLLDFGTPSNKGSTTTPTTAAAIKSVTTPVTPVDDTDPEANIGADDKDQFNNTLERVDYLLEKGKQIFEETPISKRSRDSHHQSMFETPLFSCKRKRLLSEMATMEMLPLPKRGPLIDFSTPEVTNAKRASKFAGK